MHRVLKGTIGVIVLGIVSLSCGHPTTSELLEPIPKQGVLPLPIPKNTSYRSDFFTQELKAKSSSSSEINWEVIEPILEQAQEETGSTYVAVFGVIDSVGSIYDYHLQPLAFSQEATAAANGRIRPYIYEIIKEGDQKNTTMRVAVAYIPDSDIAQRELTEWLRPNIDETATKKAKTPDGYTCYYSVEVIGNTAFFTPVYCEMDEVVVVPDGGGGGSGDWGSGGDDSSDDWNWPDDSDDSCPENCGGSNDSSGDDDYCEPGAFSSAPECEEDPDKPCEGNPVKGPEIAPTTGQGVAGGRWGASRADGTPHKGLDIKSPIGASLYSMFRGEIYAAVESQGDFGNYVIIKSLYEGETIYILYAHLNSIEVYSGLVLPGTLIGQTGDTGNAQGSVPHVHIEVRKNVDEYGYNNAPDFNPEDYFATKFDSNGNPTPPTNCN